MKVKDIIKLEEENAQTGRIILVKDGSFWRAYEHSAQRFSEKIAPSFQVRAKHYKNENRTLCFVGFPQANTMQILKKAGVDESVYTQPAFGIAYLDGFAVEEDFTVWKQLKLNAFDLPAHEKREVMMHPDRTRKNLSWMQLYKACYDLTVELHKFSALVKREYKYTIGERICNAAIDLTLAAYAVANGSAAQDEKLPVMRSSVDAIRMMLRLLVDLKHLSVKSFSNINEKIEYIYLEVK